MSDTKISEAVPVACIHPDTLAMLQSDRRADRAACSPWSEIKEMDGYVPLYTHPQPAELAEQQGVDFDIDDVRELFEQWAKGRNLTPDTWGVSAYVCPYVDNDFDVWHAAWKTLAATGKQQVGDDGMPMVCVTQEFKDQADYDAEISSTASNLLRNNGLGLSGSLPEMVAALIELASRNQVGEVQAKEVQPVAHSDSQWIK